MDAVFVIGDERNGYHCRVIEMGNGIIYGPQSHQLECDADGGHSQLQLFDGQRAESKGYLFLKQSPDRGNGGQSQQLQELPSIGAALQGVNQAIRKI